LRPLKPLMLLEIKNGLIRILPPNPTSPRPKRKKKLTKLTILMRLEQELKLLMMPINFQMNKLLSMLLPRRKPMPNLRLPEKLRKLRKLDSILPSDPSKRNIWKIKDSQE